MLKAISFLFITSFLVSCAWADSPFGSGEYARYSFSSGEKADEIIEEMMAEGSTEITTPKHCPGTKIISGNLCSKNKTAECRIENGKKFCVVKRAYGNFIGFFVVSRENQILAREERAKIYSNDCSL